MTAFGSYTVFDVLHKVGSNLPGVWYTGKAQGGSDTTIQDEFIGGTDTSYDGGTALVIDTTDDAAPKGESRLISDYDSRGAGAGDGLVTVGTAFSAAIESGDRFGLIKARFTRARILEKLNDALDEIKLPEIDDTSLDTASDDKTYALPTGVNKQNLLQVWIAADTSAPFNWQRLYHYRVDQDGGTHTLRVYRQPITTRDFRLVYWTTHSEVYADDDTIDPRIHIDLITWMTVRRLLEWRYFKFTTPPDRETNALNAALRRENTMQEMYGIVLPKETPILPEYQQYAVTRRGVPYPDVD